MDQFNHIRELFDKGKLPSDEYFDSLFPENIRKYADQHFSGCYVAKLSASFLTDQNNPNVLDVGCGIGKFCLIASLLYPQAVFTGVEYREYFVQLANQVKYGFNLTNTHFISANVIEHSFQPYNGIFLFNPFLEHRDSSARMADFYDVPENGSKYQDFIYSQLKLMKNGTRLVTYYMDRSCIPQNYDLTNTLLGGKLLFWQSKF